MPQMASAATEVTSQEDSKTCHGHSDPWCVILAAGEGKRLRSLTTFEGRTVPKQFCAPSEVVSRCSDWPSNAPDGWCPTTSIGSRGGDSASGPEPEPTEAGHKPVTGLDIAGCRIW